MKNVYLQKRGHASRMLRAIASTGLTLLFATVSYAQIRVTGKVVDTEGNPIPGAAISVEGTSTGTMADGQGNYSISVRNASDVLSYSFLGYETVQETIGNRTAINVTLAESAVAIDAVVAIGYGTRKTTDLTGSVGSVTSESIVSRGASSVMGALQGQIPGVNITQNSTVAGGGFSIQIRGQQTINGNANPLYVVDGIVVPDINFLNPGDIERVDILKDASSAAIYGSRASNGVVLVTTNQAASSREQLSITYDGYYGIRETVNLPDFTDGDEFMNFRMMAYKTITKGADNSSVFAHNTSTLSSALVGTVVLKRWATGDWYDFTKDAFPNTGTQNHFLNLNGIQGNTSYTMSMGYTQEDGSYKGNNFERINLRGGFQTKLQNAVTLGFQTNMSMINNNRGSSDALQQFMRPNPFTPIRDENGNPYPFPYNNTSLGPERYPGETISGTGYSSEYSPILNIENVVYNTRAYNVMANLFAEISPVKGLKIKTQFSPMMRTNRRGEYDGALSNYGRQRNGETRATVRRSLDWEYTWDNSIFWEGQSGDHSYDVTGVYSVYLTRNEYTETQGLALSAPSFHGIGTAAVRQSLGSGYAQSAMLSYIGRVNYSYKGKYLLTASVRHDRSSRFAPGHQGGTFPSAAVAWRISEEPFAKKWSALYNAKLRLSYGITGNNSISAYETMTGLDPKRWYGFGTTEASGQPMGAIGNKELSWEQSRELDLGLDLAFFRGRLSATIDWYDRLSKDLLMNTPVPIELGMKENELRANVGSVRNRGIELGVTGVIVDNKDWRWSVGATFSRNRNKIVELVNGDDLTNRWFIGQPISVAYTYVFDGIVTADRAVNDPLAKRHGLGEGTAIVKDLDGSGSIGPEDRTITGNAFSDWTGGITSTLSWKNLDFSFNIYADMGRYALNRQLASDGMNYQNERGRPKINVDYYVPANIERGAVPDWYTRLLAEGYNLPQHPMDNLKPNTDGTWPMPYAGTNTFFNLGGGDFQNGFQDLSYIKVRNITLGYSLPQKWVSAIRLKQIRVYANILNPWTFADKDFIGFDPEWAASGRLNGREELMGAAVRIWQFGLNVKF